MEFEGRPLAVDTRKATAMLAYLAVTGHAQSREVVAALLLAGVRHRPLAGGAAADALDAAHRARRPLRRRRPQRRSRSTSTAPGSTWPSSAAPPPTRLPTPPRSTAAVDLHRGDLLAGFGVRSSAAFDDWLQLAAEGIRRERAAALDRLVDALAAAGRGDDAVARAEQRLALDPLHEPAHRRLI